MFLWFICLTVTQTTNVNQCTVLFGVQWPMAVLGPTDIQCPMSGSTGSSGCPVSYVRQYWVQWMCSVLCQAVLGPVDVQCPMSGSTGFSGCPVSHGLYFWGHWMSMSCSPMSCSTGSIGCPV